MPIFLREFTTVEACVDAVIATVGRTSSSEPRSRLGEPNPLLNAFFRRAKTDPDLRLTIYAAKEHGHLRGPQILTVARRFGQTLD